MIVDMEIADEAHWHSESGLENWVIFFHFSALVKGLVLGKQNGNMKSKIEKR